MGTPALKGGAMPPPVASEVVLRQNGARVHALVGPAHHGEACESRDPSGWSRAISPTFVIGPNRDKIHLPLVA